MVWVGLVSYSLYLVHWPIIVFYKFRTVGPVLTFNAQVVICIASLVAAALLYVLIERPFQRGFRSGVGVRKKTFLATLCAVAVISVPASHAWATKGWNWRYSTDMQKLMDTSAVDKGVKKFPRFCFMDPSISTPIDPKCYTVEHNGKKNILLLGDSTAYALLQGLYTLLEDKANFYVWSTAVCPAVRGYDSLYGNPSCKAKMEEFFANILPKNHYDLALISQIGNHDAVRGGIAKTFEAFKEAGTPAVLVGDVPYFQDTVPNLVAKHPSTVGLDDYIKANLTEGCDDDLGTEALVPADRFFSMKQRLCHNGFPTYQVGGELIYADHLHFNGYGALFICRQIVDWLQTKALL
jgi:hypothetical protein